MGGSKAVLGPLRTFTCPTAVADGMHDCACGSAAAGDAGCDTMNMSAGTITDSTRLAINTSRPGMRLLDDVRDDSVLDEFTVMLPRERAALILMEEVAVDADKGLRG